MTRNYSKNFPFYLVPFVCGLISTLSLPPYNFFYLNFISFPFLLLFYLRLEIKKSFSSFLYGWIFGFAYFVSNIYWIANSLTVEEIFKSLIPFAITIIPLFLGIFYGISFLIFSYFKPKKKSWEYSFICPNIFIHWIFKGPYTWRFSLELNFF